MKFFRLGDNQANIFIIVFFGFLVIVTYAAINAPSVEELRSKPMWGKEKVEYEKTRKAATLHLRQMQEATGVEER